ncbi:MAG: TQO small subunit DoxD [Microbacter sp.]
MVNKNNKIINYSALYVTPVRLILGWQFFSAFLRRIVNDPEKLDPSSAAFMGHAFNHFLPHALFIKPLIAYLIVNPSLLYIFLVAFTIIEGIVGIGLIAGFFTRLSAIGATLLSFGILLGSGWLGSTCVDEWQIGIAGIAMGLVVFLTGSDAFSIDYLFFRQQKNKFTFLTSGKLNLNDLQLKRMALFFSFTAIFIALFTYQAFHNGLYGRLFNLSKEPKIEIQNAKLYHDGSLNITLYRTDGPDTYGAFITQIMIMDKNNVPLEIFHPNKANSSYVQIKDFFFNKSTLNDMSLTIPLGAKTQLLLKPDHALFINDGDYKVIVQDVSGLKWNSPISLN